MMRINLLHVVMVALIVAALHVVQTAISQVVLVQEVHVWIILVDYDWGALHINWSI